VPVSNETRMAAPAPCSSLGIIAPGHRPSAAAVAARVGRSQVKDQSPGEPVGRTAYPPAIARSTSARLAGRSAIRRIRYGYQRSPKGT